MTLVQKLREDLLTACKARDSILSGWLTTLLRDAEAICKTKKREITDAEFVALVKKYLKNLDITIADVNEATTFDLQVKLRYLLQLDKERVVYMEFLPQQLTEAQLRVLISEIKDSGATKVGQIMKSLKTNYDGMYDGSLVSKIVKES